MLPLVPCMLDKTLSTSLVHQMPHYHIVEATEAVKPVLGDYFVEPEKSGPIPFHLMKRFFKGTEVSACPVCDTVFNLGHKRIVPSPCFWHSRRTRRHFRREPACFVLVTSVFPVTLTAIIWGYFSLCTGVVSGMRDPVSEKILRSDLSRV